MDNKKKIIIGCIFALVIGIILFFIFNNNVKNDKNKYPDIVEPEIEEVDDIVDDNIIDGEDDLIIDEDYLNKTR